MSDSANCPTCGSLWSQHTKDFPCCQRSAEWFRGFEAAHELMECGHSRGDLRDPNWEPGQVAGNYFCVGCEMQSRTSLRKLIEDKRDEWQAESLKYSQSAPGKAAQLQHKATAASEIIAELER